LPPDGQALWQEVKPLVNLIHGVLVIDNSTLDKSYASQMALVTRDWSGKHHGVVQGIHLISLVRMDRECRLPSDFRLYNKVADGLSKNDYFRHMVEQAQQRGFAQDMVVFDSWCSVLANPKLLRSLGWHKLTQLKSNREVSLDRSGNRAISEIFIPSQGCRVHLKGYGWVKVFRTVGTHGDAEYWATNRLEMILAQAAFHALVPRRVDDNQRGIKHFTGVERGQYQLEVS
jgi:putative transposase